MSTKRERNSARAPASAWGPGGKVIADAMKAGVISLTEQTIAEMPVWGSFVRIGGNLTPQQVSGIIQSADMGRPHLLVDLTHECREKDGHLHSVLETRECSVAGLPWLIVPEGDNPRKRDIKRANQCKLAISRAEGLREAIAHIVGEPLLFGHGTVEIVWRMAEPSDGPMLRGLMLPTRLVPVATRRFAFRQADSALLYDPATDTGGNSDVSATGVDLMNEFPHGKFLQVRRRINGDVLTREGLCRVLMWAALFRNWTLRDWLTAAEIGWKPWRVGKFKKSASSEDITILKSALQRMSSTGTAALPETVDLLVEWPKGATSSTQSLHKELCEFLAGEISKAVLGQTLTTEAGARGARSLGDTQAANSLRPRIEADAEVISSALTRDLVSAFYQINFGNAEGARWVFQTEDRQNTEAFAKAIKDLRDAGLEIPAGWVRDQIGMPPPKPGEEMLAGAEAEESEDDDSESNGNGGKEADSEDSSEDSGESSDDSKE